MFYRCIVILTLTLPALGQNLVVHYELNETSGTLVSDSSVNGLDAQTMGGTSWVPGWIGGGLALDGLTGHTTAPHDPLHNVAQLTIAAWVNVNVLENWDGILTKGLGISPYSLALGSPIGKFKFEANQGGGGGGGVGGGIFASAGDLTTGQWHHVAATFDGQEVRLYLDGALDSVHLTPGMVLATTAQDLTLGADFPGGDEYLDGTLDDVRLYDGALSANDITNLYGYNSALFCNPANPHSGGGFATLGTSTVSGPGFFHLEAIDGPPDQFAYFLVSGSFADPGLPVSQGQLCLGPPQGRYSPAAGGSLSSIGQFDGAGVLQNLAGTSSVGTGFDVPAALPSPPGGVIAAGDTWYFQLWYRDGAASNFSDGIAVTF